MYKKVLHNQWKIRHQKLHNELRKWLQKSRIFLILDFLGLNGMTNYAFLLRQEKRWQTLKQKDYNYLRLPCMNGLKNYATYSDIENSNWLYGNTVRKMSFSFMNAFRLNFWKKCSRYTKLLLNLDLKAVLCITKANKSLASSKDII